MKRKGFTLVEVVISVAIFTFIGAMLYAILTSGMSSYSRNTGVMELQQDARNGLDRIVREVRESSVSYVENSGHSFRFSTPYKGDTIFSLDGTNQLVREYPADVFSVMARDITSLNFSKDDAMLTISVQAAKTIYSKVYSFSLQETVRLRNEND